MVRANSRQGDLARRGFRAPERIEPIIAEWPAAVVARVSQSADPDGVVSDLRAVEAAAPGTLERLAADEELLARTVAVCAASDELARWLARRPEGLEAISRPEDIDAVREVPSPDELRLRYRAALAAIAADDSSAPDPAELQPDISRRLSALADATLQAACRLAEAEVKPTASRLAVLAMGKCGAQELNYISDVDVIFVVEPAGDASTAVAVEEGTRWASALMRICSDHTPAGAIWQVDANLRPEGKRGPLVRSLAAMRSYYAQWAKPWEFQALLKARPVAGDLELGREFVALVAPQVWRIGDTPGFVADTQAMRRRVVSLLPAREAARELKLGAGGLRDVEFTVQLLQLIHGRADPSLRVAGTLEGLAALVAGGYIGRSDGAELAEAYRWLRVLEHRVQLLQLRRTHLLPDSPALLERLSAELGCDVAERWESTSRRVQQLHRRLFYSPLLAAVATVPSEELRLDSAAAQARLAGLGYTDPRQALQHIKALTSGLTRAAQIRRQLMPALLGWFAGAANPDAGLLAFRQVSEALGATPWYLRALRDEGAMAERLAAVLSASRYAVGLIMRDPSAVELLADESRLAPRPAAEVASEMAVVAARHDDPAAAVAAIRTVRRRELLRLAAADIVGVSELEATGAALADLASATVAAALEVAGRGRDVEVGVVAMGRWGGRESSFGSDVDAMFVAREDADVAAATAVVTELRRLLAAAGPDPALPVDADLRPEGKNGQLVRSVDSYLAYYARWASAWEAQALVRARHGAGSEPLVDAVLSGVSGLRWPESGPSAAGVEQTRRLKSRMERERAGRDPAHNVKLGPGGLSDVEWSVQLLQLRYAGTHPELRTTSTLPALSAAVSAGLLDAEDAAALAAAWRLASRVRNGVMLVRGRPSDSLPHDATTAAAVGQLLGYGRSGAADLAEDWLRASRRSRAAFERVFWESGS